MDFQHITTNKISLHVAQAGHPTGELVILLHGFPEFWYGWKNQIEPLAAAGYRLWIPDQRGYNLSDKPQGIKAYNLDTLAEDILGLIDAAGEQQATLIAHDWGGIVAWWLATHHPERVKKLVILNVPHPSVLRALFAKERYWPQIKASWYIFFFQLPYLAERYMRKNAPRALKGGAARRGVFSPEDIATYQKAWDQPNALTAMINWYRAILQSPPKQLANKELPKIDVPTLILWGEKDRFLTRYTAERTAELLTNGRLIFFEESGHFIQHELPKEVNATILEFLGS